jgi:predicted NUDIX family phosphoesterase
MTSLVEKAITGTIYVTQPNKRLPQFILAVDSAYYGVENVALKGGGVASLFANPINQVPHELFCDNVQSYLVIREREYLDEALGAVFIQDTGVLYGHVINAKGEKKKGDPRYKQLLPYLVARQLQADGTYVYFPYRRTKKVGEQRLAGNGSLGYGGHIDLEDIVSTNSVINLKATILKSALREAIEEFTLSNSDFGSHRVTAGVYADAISFGDLFIVDNSNDVGELHLGIILYFDVPLGWTLEASEDELAKLPPMNAEQMRTDQTFNAENWTKIFLTYLKMQDLNQLAADNGLAPNPDAVISIDHGGVKVAEVDSKILDNMKSILEVGDQMATIRAGSVDAVERIQLHIQAGDETEARSITREDVPIPTNEKQAINFGRSGTPAKPGTPEHLAKLQNAAFASYRGDVEVKED